MARSKRHKGATRDAGGFVAIPWSVLDSDAYRALSHPARSMLVELARQFRGDDNGRLLLSAAYLKKRGWNSDDVIHRAKNELLAGGFVHMTVQGQRPNKASWYALTWMPLDKLAGFDIGAEASFERSAYRLKAPLPPIAKNGPLTPSHGIVTPPIAPCHGVESPRTAP